MTKPLKLDQVWQERILEQVEGLQYGQILITVHDGQIVQIDRTERTRYQLSSAKETGRIDRASAVSSQKDTIHIAKEAK